MCVFLLVSYHTRKVLLSVYYLYFISFARRDKITLEIIQRYSKRIENKYQYILSMISKLAGQVVD